MYGGNQGNSQYPQQGQQYPPQDQQGGYPPQGGQAGQGYPPQQGGQQYPQQGGQGYPPQQGGQGYPQQGQQLPGHQGGYPQQQGGAPGGYPQQYGGAPGGYPQQQGGAPGGYPQQQGGFQQQHGGQPGYGGGAAAPIVGQQYCLPQEQVFFLTEKLMSVSGDDFEVVDALNPSHRYQLKSSSMSMSGSRQLKDSAGKTILNMKHKLMSGKLWYINRGSDDKDVIAEVKKPSGTSGGRQSCEVFLKGNTSHHFSTARPDLVVSGDVKGKTFLIYRGQQPIAEISRKLPEESSKQRITGKDAYALKVHPGQDAAFSIALVLVVDELYND